MNENGGSRPLRVLVTSTPGTGHITPLMPVAVALRAAGHTVHWAIATDGGDAVAAMGFEWSPAGVTVPTRRKLSEPDLPRIMALPPAQRRGPLFAALFARIAAPVMREDLTALFDTFRPELVVRETGEVAAVPMSLARDVPLVTVGFSGVIPEWARGEGLDALAPLWRAEGLGAPSWDELFGRLYLHPFPPSFDQRPEADVVRDLRPTAVVPTDDPPPWLALLGAERDGVYVTAGTEVLAVTYPWAEVFSALARLDVDAVATIGRHVDLSKLGDVPSNVHVERFVPQARVLEQVSAVISHGGAGTVLGTAARGLPHIVVPLFADQWENGTAVSEAGCGMILDPDRRSSEDIERSLHEVLTDRSYRDAATRVAAEIAVMPTAEQLLPEIEGLVR